MEENDVVSGIKCSAKILESEKRHWTTIAGNEEVRNSKQSSFNGVTSTVS